MNSVKVGMAFAFIAGVATTAVLAILVLGTEPRDIYAAPFPDRFDQRLELQISLARPGGRLVNEGRIYRRCEDSEGRLVGPQPEGLNERGNPHDGRFIDYRPDGSKTTWVRNGMPWSTWCWRS